MVWKIIACALAAGGLVLFSWCLIGAFLLPAAGTGLTVRLTARGDAPELEQTVRGVSWLVQTGLLEAPLEIVDSGLTPAARRRAECLARRHSYISLIRQRTAEELGNEKIGSTTGDDPRQCRRGGLSE